MPIHLPYPQEAGVEAKVIDQQYAMAVDFIWRKSTFRASQAIPIFGFFHCSPQDKFVRKVFVKNSFSPVFPMNSFGVLRRNKNEDQRHKLSGAIPAGRAPDFPSRRLRKGKKNEKDGESPSDF